MRIFGIIGLWFVVVVVVVVVVAVVFVVVLSLGFGIEIPFFCGEDLIVFPFVWNTFCFVEQIETYYC